MKETRNLDVQGLQPNWPAGDHLQASVSLKAEQFCLGCHVKASVGESLGTVQVRSYLGRKEALWWQEVRFTAGALSLKILAHTIVLLLLLKVRMEPLLSLRSTVPDLAKGMMDLSPRADVKSDDEFGELAQDLNHFLDRIGELVRDLDKILGEVVSVGTRLGALNRDLEQQLDGLRDASLQAIGDSAQHSLGNQLVVARESGAFDALAQALDEMVASGVATEVAQPYRAQLQRLRSSFAAVVEASKHGASPQLPAQAQADEYRAFALSLREMARLEATMQQVAESGQRVLHRLATGRPAANAQEPR